MKSLSEQLDLDEKALWRIRRLVGKGRAYTTFEIPKRSGGVRTISKPIAELFHVQRRIKTRILDAADSFPPCVTAFRPGYSILDNAVPHCGKAILIKFDIKDFFPAISFTRVANIFGSLGLNKSDSKTLAYLTTVEVPDLKTSIRSRYFHEKRRLEMVLKFAHSHYGHRGYSLRAAWFDHTESDVRFWTQRLIDDWATQSQLGHPPSLKRRGLPQGAPTSPQLANLALARLDVRLSGLAESLGFVYTRYADGLSFSSNDPMAKASALKLIVARIVMESGFSLNRAKTAIMRAPSLRQTTGLVVNDLVPRVRRVTIRRVRAMLHQQKLGKLDETGTAALSGYLSYIRMINPQQAQKLQQLD